jgi:LmbE family N-acetylglucosaminyl deacetylase
MDERAPLPRTVERPTRGRVLVLAPHADDDVLGCGGTACLHAEQEDPVHVLIVYDGLFGDPDGRFEPEEYRQRRRAEARAGGAHLGLERYEFWDYPEGHLPSDVDLAAAAQRIAGRIGELAPDVIYAPWVGEHHVDHHALGRAARLALSIAGFRGEAWGYEVWTPLVPTLIVDITPVFERKRSALLEHESQLAYRDILHKGLALNAQRAMYLSSHARHGEAFAPLGAPSPADSALVR